LRLAIRKHRDELVELLKRYKDSRGSNRPPNWPAELEVPINWPNDLPAPDHLADWFGGCLLLWARKRRCPKCGVPVEVLWTIEGELQAQWICPNCGRIAGWLDIRVGGKRV